KIATTTVTSAMSARLRRLKTARRCTALLGDRWCVRSVFHRATRPADRMPRLTDAARAAPRILKAPMSPRLTLARRIVQLFFGLFCYGFGIALMVRAEVGIAPWDVLSQGIMLNTGIAFGTITIILSIIVLLLWIPIKQRLGIGTVLNALLVGPFADVGLFVLRTPDTLVGQILLFIA